MLFNFELQVLVHFFLFVFGIKGLIFHRNNVIIVLMCIELILLSANLNFLFFATMLDDIIGQIASLLILTIGAAEASIGIAIIILSYRMHGALNIKAKTSLKG